MASKTERQQRYDYFVNEILDDVVMESEKVIKYKFDEPTKRFTIYCNNLTFDFYPTSDKIMAHGKNSWKENGLEHLLKYINN